MVDFLKNQAPLKFRHLNNRQRKTPENRSFPGKRELFYRLENWGARRAAFRPYCFCSYVSKPLVLLGLRHPWLSVNPSAHPLLWDKCQRDTTRVFCTQGSKMITDFRTAWICLSASQHCWSFGYLHDLLSALLYRSIAEMSTASFAPFSTDSSQCLLTPRQNTGILTLAYLWGYNRMV